MNLRCLLLPCATLFAGVAFAQSATPSHAPPGDRWEAVPATGSSSNYRANRSVPGSSGSSHSPFHFKQPAKGGPAYLPAPQANDKAAVMGKRRPWQNGRPPVDCAREPWDPACH
jgi:hypothetical protein